LGNCRHQKSENIGDSFAVTSTTGCIADPEKVEGDEPFSAPPTAPVAQDLQGA
jgi:hypothetical protein